VERRGAIRRRHVTSRRTRPRFGRITLLLGSFTLTFVAAGAAVGFVPYESVEEPANASAEADPDDLEAAPTPAAPSPTPTPDVATEPEMPPETPRQLEHGDPAHAPKHSGQGRRVVYDMSDQRVWLVGADDKVRRSYLVSGSVYDNLDPGAFDVYSRSRYAVSFDGLSTMEYMVRFTEGANAAIGFHDIPEDPEGNPVQTADQLGTPRSHGCIRQRPVDAKAMWRFADVGTPVRVLA
jgi:L,D-transpeptidase catalytic domain